ncbi:MAG: hypothetical protein Kow00128_12240 [Deltaproteobacteria bacterium]
MPPIPEQDTGFPGETEPRGRTGTILRVAFARRTVRMSQLSRRLAGEEGALTGTFQDRGEASAESTPLTVALQVK